MVAQADAGHQPDGVRARVRRASRPIGTFADQPNYLAFAARAFFENGGRRLYVSRVFPFHARRRPEHPRGPGLRRAAGRDGGDLAGAMARRGRQVDQRQGRVRRSKNVLVTPPAGTSRRAPSCGGSRRAPPSSCSPPTRTSPGTPSRRRPPTRRRCAPCSRDHRQRRADPGRRHGRRGPADRRRLPPRR